jgi:hypothetical protein
VPDDRYPSRDPPEDVKARLRREVNFGCPVRYLDGSGCGCPMLTYHHFDPPWAGHFVHNPDGMIALCPAHHEQADGGGWTKSQLQEFKRSPYVDSLLRCRWPWTVEKLIIRFGPCLTLTDGSPLWLYGKPILGFRPQQNPNFGNAVVSFDSYIEDHSGSPWLRIEDGSFSLETNSTRDFIFKPQTNLFDARNGDGTTLTGRFRHIPVADFDAWWRGFDRKHRFRRAADGYASSGDFLKRFDVIDSDGRVPIVSVTGKFTTRHVSVMITSTKMTAQCLNMGPAGHLDMPGTIFPSGMYASMNDAERGGLEFLRLG